MAVCSHIDRIRVVDPSGDGCRECVATGSTWVHLRLCLECGHVGCCDSSPNRHAREHWRAHRHPLIQSFEPGERWGWCFEDEIAIRVPPGLGATGRRPR